MGYYSSSGVIQGLHFEESEWISSEPDRFYDTEIKHIPAKQSCPHDERIGTQFCPKCGTKVRDRKAKDKKVKSWKQYPCDLLESGLLESRGLTHFQYTDGEVTFHAIGVSLAEMEESTVRGVDILGSTEEADDELMERLRALEWFTDVFLLNHLGTWFIQGGS